MKAAGPYKPLRALLAYLALVAAVTALPALGLAAFGLVAPPALAAASGSSADTQPVARAVLFYSPACSHCRELIRNELPPILRRYGSEFRLLAVDASAEPGTSLFRTAVGRYGVPPPERGVPAVVIGDRYLAGTSAITARLPALISEHLSRGGVAWPALPGLEALVSGPSMTGSSPDRLLAATERPDGILDRLARDRWGNAAALIVLAGMAVALGSVLLRVFGRRGAPQAPPATRPEGRGRASATAVLIAAGLAVSGYLTYAAATGSSVLCGSLSSCDVVQDSTYARVLGLPVAYVGLAGYVLIGAAFLTALFARGRTAQAADRALFALTLGGTAFSLYLTALEPFVLGATCLWCLASATIMTLLLLLAARRLRPSAEASTAGGAAPRRAKSGAHDQREHARSQAG